MEKNTLEERIQVVTAQYEGRELEYWDRLEEKWVTRTHTDLGLSFNQVTYRVKQESQLTHWGFEDYPKVPRYYRHKKNGDIRTIWFKNYEVAFQGSVYSYEDFAKFHELVEEDGSLTALYKAIKEDA